jgi:hypothetical protein
LFFEKIGAARGIRTPDPIITNDVLYRLSYCGIPTVRAAFNCPDRRCTPARIHRASPDLGDMAFPGKRVLPPHLGLPSGNEVQTRLTPILLHLQECPLSFMRLIRPFGRMSVQF